MVCKNFCALYLLFFTHTHTHKTLWSRYNIMIVKVWGDLGSKWLVIKLVSVKIQFRVLRLQLCPFILCLLCPKQAIWTQHNLNVCHGPTKTNSQNRGTSRSLYLYTGLPNSICFSFLFWVTLFLCIFAFFVPKDSLHCRTPFFQAYLLFVIFKIKSQNCFFFFLKELLVIISK